MKMLKKEQGFSLIEILIALSSATVVIVSIFSLITASQRLNTAARAKSEAVGLAGSALEIAFYLRDHDWPGLQALASEHKSYYPRAEAGDWSLSEGEEHIGAFSRTMRIEHIRRDGAGRIDESGSIADPDLLKVTAFVSWPEREQVQKIELTGFVANVQE